MTKSFQLHPPLMPNFIKVGYKNSENALIPITDLTEEEAQEYGELIKQTFIQHHKKRLTTDIDQKLNELCQK